jgi:hypothetical protein
MGTHNLWPSDDTMIQWWLNKWGKRLETAGSRVQWFSGLTGEEPATSLSLVMNFSFCLGQGERVPGSTSSVDLAWRFRSETEVEGAPKTITPIVRAKAPRVDAGGFWSWHDRDILPCINRAGDRKQWRVPIKFGPPIAFRTDTHTNHYSLVMTNIAIEAMAHRNSWFIYSKRWFSSSLFVRLPEGMIYGFGA